MKMLKQLLSAVALSIIASTAVAQTESTTPNLITSGTNHTWTGVTTGSMSMACPPDGGACSGGPGAMYDPSTNTIHFSNGLATAAQTFAINQALSNAGTGIQVRGYNYSWEINNLNYDNRQPGTDTLTARVLTYNADGALRRTDSWLYNTKFDWTTFSGSVNYVNPAVPSSFGNLRVEFEGRDSGGWGGYFGPQVRNVSLGLRYAVDECSINPQSSPSCPGYKTYYTLYDDDYAHVPLPFSFPFYGRLFTNSWIHSNGVVSFLDPLSVTEPNDGGWAYCCGGPDLSQNTSYYGSRINYLIAPFWTDLYPDQDSRIYTTKGSNWIKYHWDSVPDITNGANRNTFNLELGSSGSIAASYGTIMSQQHVTAGTIGNLQLGEKTHSFFGIPGISGISNWSLNSTQAVDCSNPLVNPLCPGYAEAYTQYQVSECSINPLAFNGLCQTLTPTVWFDYKCSESSLYSEYCPGYATAYLADQCSRNSLYSPSCPGYAQAQINQCNSNILSFDGLCQSLTPTAWFNYQCGLNGLYSRDCTNYADAYYVQQCTADPLYDSGCTGYAEAYALKFIVNSPAPSSEPTVVAVTTETASTPQLVADPVVNQAVTTTTTSASPAQPVAPVQLAPAPQPVTAVVAKTEEKKEEKKEETKNETAENKESTSTTTTSTASADNKDQPKTTRQALAERRLEAARAQAIEQGKQLAGKMGEAASMEAQIQVQGVVMAAMGFVPGFDNYGRVALPDVVGYKPFEIYKGQRNVDNPAGRRFLTGADAKHQEMVDQQYAR